MKEILQNNFQQDWACTLTKCHAVPFILNLNPTSYKDLGCFHTQRQFLSHCDWVKIESFTKCQCRETQMICDLIYQTTGMWKRQLCIVPLSFLPQPHGVCFVARTFLVFVCMGTVCWDSALGQRLYWIRNCAISDRPWKESGRKASREEVLRAHMVLAPRPNTLYNILKYYWYAQ